MNGPVYLALYHDLSTPEPKYSVRLEQSDPLQFGANGLAHCSLSPIFSLRPDVFVPQENDSFKVLFVVHREPFVALGTFGAEIQRFIWFSLGIAPIIAILPADRNPEDVYCLMEPDGVLCQETWIVENGLLQKPIIEFHTQNADSVSQPTVEALPSNEDLRHVIRELHLNFDSLMKRARVLMPSLAPTTVKMLAAMQKEIQKMVAREPVLVKPTVSNTGTSNAIDTVEYLAAHKRINLSIDALIQLNSALAYILSQSFYGGPPMTQNLSLNSCHSLLGIGTAIKAIQKLTEFIIEGFANFPVAQILKSRYPLSSVSIYLKGNEGQSLTPDDFFDDGQRSPQTPKLAYFSTRSGFSEHGYCVTAATQCLTSAGSARRSLLTLTHELLHSHVKGLLATILANSAELDAEDAALLPLVREYKESARQAEEDGAAPLGWSISKFLRFRIFAFCDGMQKVVTDYPGCRVDDDRPVNLLSGPVDDYSELERFKNSFNFLNEIVVHILDLHYFYDRSERIFLATLWKSWATVPGVADKVEWYILRSLAATSVINMHGLSSEDFSAFQSVLEPNSTTLDERFSEALATFTGTLEELCADSESSPMLHVVSAKLKDLPTRRWLRAGFFPCHLFAQIVKQFLYSPRLREYFDSFEDALSDRTEDGEPIYQLAAREFPGVPVRNPIALLRDRLLREINGEKTSSEEADSAWLFLALSSLASDK